MFELKKNPFVVLGVSPRSSKADIHNAIEDALLDTEGVDEERALDIARQALIAPNERLKAELSYLLELRPSEARKALAGEGFAHWLDVAESTFGVAKANAQIEAIKAGGEPSAQRAALLSAFEDWTEIGEAQVLGRINEDRASADFIEATRADIRQGLQELRAFHADEAVGSLHRKGDLSQQLTQLLTDEIIPAGRLGEKFITSIIAAYAKRTGGALANSAERAVESLNRYAGSGDETDFSNFADHLERWDEIAQPLQLAQEAKGADDAHSLELYEEIREKALQLANDEGRHHEALQITKLSRKVFAELPWAVEKLKEDAQILTSVIADKTRNKFLIPLATALNEAREKLSWTSQQLSAHGFASDAPDPIGAMWRAYADLLRVEIEEEVRDIGANMVRNLSIELFNERQDVLQAKMLTSQLAADSDWFSEEVRDQILHEEGQLSRNLEAHHMTDAMKRQDWRRAKELSDKLAIISPPSEMADLHMVAQVIDQKLREQRNSRILWGGIGAVVLGFIVFGGSESTTYDGDEYDYADPGYSTTTYTSNLDGSADAMEDADEIAAAAELDMGSGAGDNESYEEESAPPAYIAGALSLPQLRYCLRQDERLKYARPLTRSYAQTSRFNSAISDFNSRCGSFRYDYSDMATARTEIASMRAQLQLDARSIVGADASPPVAPYSSPSSYPFSNGSTASPDVDDWSPEEIGEENSYNTFDEWEGDYP